MITVKKALVYTLIAAGLIFESTSAVAIDQQGNFQVYGNLPCSAYVNNLKQGDWPQAAMKSLVAGFVSGVNLQSPNTYDVLGQSSLDDAVLWLKNYCDKNPLEKVGKPMTELMAELFAKRKQTKP